MAGHFEFGQGADSYLDLDDDDDEGYEGGARLLQVVRGADELEHDPLERLQDNNCNRSHEDNHLLSYRHLDQSGPTKHRHEISRFIL